MSYLCIFPHPTFSRYRFHYQPTAIRPVESPPKSKLLISGSKSLLAAPDDTIQFPISNPTNLLR